MNRLRLEHDTWEKAGEPFLCDWCHNRVEILDRYWTALFSIRRNNPDIPEYSIMKVCADCATKGPPLESVMPR